MAHDYTTQRPGAPAFTVSANHAAELASMEPSLREMCLRDLIDQHIYDNRQIIGVLLVLAPHGRRCYTRDFNARADEFMETARAALAVALRAEAA